MKNYWQVAAGSYGREYYNEFIKYGIAFVGGEKQVETMKCVQLGDFIILKKGISKIIAVGQVVNRGGQHRGFRDKEWLMDFDGWDLPSYCYVEWHVPPKPLSVKGLTRSTIQNIWKPAIISTADACFAANPTSFVEPEPVNTIRIEKDEELVDFLIRKGLRISAAEELISTFSRIRRLANYYYHQPDWEEIREHEVRTFLIVPLLLAMGWAEQSIKIEQPVTGGRVDIALFNGPFSGNPEEAVALIETKGFAQGLSYAPKQAISYTKHFPNCKVVFVSNGYCYKAYKRTKTGFSIDPSAYLNILDPREAYPLNPKILGAYEALNLLLKTN
jgi:hypothetical protein